MPTDSKTCALFRISGQMAAGVKVSKEYVREQLHSMGVRDLSEKDLEAYTNDFAKLIQKHLQEQTPLSETSTGGSSFSSANSSSLYSGKESFREHAPPQCQRKSAVFKTFPGDKENRVYPVPASATPSPWRRAQATPPHTTAGHSPHDRGGPASVGVGREDGEVGKPIIITRKRKTLRKVNGEARVFEESYTSVEASPSVGSVTSDLGELSLASLTPTESSSPEDSSPSSSSSSSSLEESHKAPRKTQCKSFIRPATAQLYTRILKKHDPVSRYHYWKEVWQREKFPGVDSRSALRWQIREQMMQQDLPFFVPPRRPVKVNKYTVPTDKKRAALRWEIRHQMAEQ